jgi:hypothetical protein
MPYFRWSAPIRSAKVAGVARRSSGRRVAMLIGAMGLCGLGGLIAKANHNDTAGVIWLLFFLAAGLALALKSGDDYPHP